VRRFLRREVIQRKLAILLLDFFPISHVHATNSHCTHNNRKHSTVAKEDDPSKKPKAMPLSSTKLQLARDRRMPPQSRDVGATTTTTTTRDRQIPPRSQSGDGELISRTRERPTMPSRSLSVKDIDRFRKMEQQHKSPSQRDLRLKSESWSDFHEKHHSVDYKNSSEFMFKNGCSRPSLFAHILNRHPSWNKCWAYKISCHDEKPRLIAWENFITSISYNLIVWEKRGSCSTTRQYMHIRITWK